MVSWKEQQKIIEDSQQYLLNPDLTISRNEKSYTKKQQNIKFNDIVLCPFCLKSYELDKFSLRKGFRVCPNCTSKLKLTTLSEINNLDKFVQFVFNYRFSGFWSKICLDIPKKGDNRFKEWNKRLSDLGISVEFWEKYKNLKGDSIYEGY